MLNVIKIFHKIPETPKKSAFAKGSPLANDSKDSNILLLKTIFIMRGSMIKLSFFDFFDLEAFTLFMMPKSSLPIRFACY